MTMIQIDLPEATATAAREAGLLTPASLARLLEEAIRRREAGLSLLSLADAVAAAGIKEMSMDEINAEVKAARAERLQSEASIATPSAEAVGPLASGY